MDRTRLQRIAGVVLLLGVAFPIAGGTPVAASALVSVPQRPVSGPRPEPALTALDRPTVGSRAPVALTGWLSIVWGDGPPGSTRSSGPLYTLTGDDGRSIELAIGRRSVRASGRLLALNGRRVVVRGSWLRVPAEEAGAPVLRLDAIELDPASRAAEGPAADVVGSQPWISLLCKFSDVAAEPKPLSYFQNMYGTAYPRLDHYWRELSYDTIDLLGSDATGWFTLPHPRSYYVYDSNNDGELEFAHAAAANDCTAAADPDVYFPDYVGINLMFNDDLDGYAWGGRWYMTLDGVTRTWYMTWEPPWGYGTLAVIGHEMGHGFGLPHSSGSYGQTYDNYWDVMSKAGGTCTLIDPTYGCVGQHTISFHKDLLGWIAPGDNYQAALDTQATITLERLALPLSGNYRMAQIPIGEAADHFYTVEARRQVGYDGQLPGQAVIIHEVVGGHAYVLDPDLNGNTGDAGAMWLPGESFVDAAHDITVTVEAQTASGFAVTIALAPQGGFTNCADQTEIPEAECAALQALYTSTDGSHWTSNSGWLDSAWPCSWAGVTCGGSSPQHVIELSLPTNGLAGPLPAQLGDLSALELLDLSGNGLTGGIPSSLGGLAELWGLGLYNNQLDGGIPPELGDLAKLEYLYLDQNGFTGVIPSALGSLDSLVGLDLGQNQLTGPIPPELGDLNNLVYLSLYDNQLDGGIPPQLGDLSNLSNLYLFLNHLTGNIPAELGGLGMLAQMYLDANRLGGSIPAALGSLSNLRELSLSYNQLDGIPVALANLTGLDWLDLGYNSLSATDPGLVVFLNGKDPDWDQTQTVPPANLHVAAAALHSIELAWETIPYWQDGGYYEIGYATAPGGPYTVHGTTAGTGGKTATGYLAEGLLAATPYHFVVRAFTPAHDFQQNELWSEYTAEISGTTAACATPAVPNLVTPGDGSHTADSTPTFEWEVAAASDEYELQVATEPGFTSPEIEVATAETAYTPAGSLADDTYFWHVRGHNTSEACDVYGDWSDVWTVTVDTVAPSGSILINDGDDYTREPTVTLTLTATDNVTVTGMNLLYNGGWKGWEAFAASQEITLLGGDGIHAVSVQYRDAAGNSSASSTDTIELDTTPPAVPVLLSPEDGTTTDDSTPTFAWSAPVGAVGYELQVDNGATFDSPEIDLITPSTSHTLGSPLVIGTHSWWVRARDAAGNWSAWSSAWSLEIDPGWDVFLYLPLVLNHE